MYFFFYCASLTCTVCMYICIFNIYIALCVLYRCEGQTHSLGHRNARRIAKIFQRRSYGEKSALDRAFLEFSINRSSSLTLLFPVHASTDGTSKSLSTPATRVRGQARQRSTTHVYLRYLIIQNFKSIPTFSLRDSIFARTTEADGNAGLSAPSR